MSDPLRVLESSAAKTMQKIQDLYNEVDDVEDGYSTLLSDIEDWDVSIKEYQDGLTGALKGKAQTEKKAKQAAAKIQKTRQEIRDLAAKLISEIDASTPATHGEKVDKKKVAAKSMTKHVVDEMDALASREI